ncbi:spore coat U domain-containing protein [Hyphomicrobium sp. CS1GBMeth3]|uniref:Csu type fimbrial protein n=1 Tax=Hyphomicrobium sp. CS1GBMeth3 TaxID=1892845 RepID=UPI000931576D|nr:spore coat U domain-containing protein [Hyphomicrobium sp. CS1GBMeth3]
MKRSTVFQCLGGSALVAMAGAGAALAATATGNFNAQIIIQGECIVAATNTLDFGTTGVLSADIDQTTTFEVQCTNSTPYSVGLDAGTGVGASTLLRRMTGGSDTVDYQMFSDPSRTVNWGDNVGVDTVAGVGNGSPQALTIYGRVISQATPEPDTYIDTVTIEVTY